MATQIQSQISSVLQQLGFEMESTMPGAVEQHKVTRSVMDNLENLLKENKSVWVKSSGDVEIK